MFKKHLFLNFVSLGTIQAVNVVLPLVLLPYLVRVLGLEGYGLFAYALSIVMYFDIFVRFGFDLSATRGVSLVRDERDKLARVFNVVLASKMVLFAASVIIFIVVVFLVSGIRKYLDLYVLMYLLVLGNAITPGWFFQGIEKMGYLSRLTVLPKIVATLLMFVIVTDKEDYVYVALLNGLASVITGIWSLWVINRKFGIGFDIVPIGEVLKQIKESSGYFFSQGAGRGVRYYAVTITGAYLGEAAVGAYSIIERIYNAYRSVLGMVSQVIYPYMIKHQDIKLWLRSVLALLGVSALFSAFLVIYHEPVLDLVVGEREAVVDDMFQVVMGAAIAAVINIMFGYPLLGACGYVGNANISFVYASVIGMIWVTWMVFGYGDLIGVSAGIVVTELMGFIIRGYYVWEKGIFKAKWPD